MRRGAPMTTDAAPAAAHDRPIGTGRGPAPVGV